MSLRTYRHHSTLVRVGDRTEGAQLDAVLRILSHLDGK
jgi:hypothetical protein